MIRNILFFIFYGLTNILLSQPKCSYNEILCYEVKKLDNKKQSVLFLKYIYFEEGKLERFVHFNEAGNAVKSVIFHYNEDHLCDMVYVYENEVYSDTTFASFDKQGNLIPIRQATGINVGKAKDVKILKDRCGRIEKVVYRRVNRGDTKKILIYKYN